MTAGILTQESGSTVEKRGPLNSGSFPAGSVRLQHGSPVRSSLHTSPSRNSIHEPLTDGTMTQWHNGTRLTSLLHACMQRTHVVEFGVVNTSTYTSLAALLGPAAAVSENFKDSNRTRQDLAT